MYYKILWIIVPTIRAPDRALNWHAENPGSIAARLGYVYVRERQREREREGGGGGRI